MRPLRGLLDTHVLEGTCNDAESYFAIHSFCGQGGRLDFGWRGVACGGKDVCLLGWEKETIYLQRGEGGKRSFETYTRFGVAGWRTGSDGDGGVFLRHALHDSETRQK